MTVTFLGLNLEVNSSSWHLPGDSDAPERDLRSFPVWGLPGSAMRVLTRFLTLSMGPWSQTHCDVPDWCRAADKTIRVSAPMLSRRSGFSGYCPSRLWFWGGTSHFARLGYLGAKGRTRYGNGEKGDQWMQSEVKERVASELNVELGDFVGYKLRFDECTSSKTRIKFVTEGTLIRELASDRELNQYSAIILDEAHERTIHTNKVSKFFCDCTVINVPGRLFPVETSYSDEQPDCYLKSALDKAIEIHSGAPEGDVLIFLPGKDDIQELIEKLIEKLEMFAKEFDMDAQVLPLYGSLTPRHQASLPSFYTFTASPPNCRRFIVSTNIAETSITVPGIRYVIDSGFMKQKEYNASTGISFLNIVPVSKGQAKQRAGRAGRLRSGRCFRLYTLDFYLDTLPDDAVPEIQRSPITSSVLFLKSLQLDVKNFGFLDAPSSESVDDALRVLFLIDAIDENRTLTTIGKHMAELPLEPPLARFLLEAAESGCLHQAVPLAAMLSVEGSFFHQKSINTASSPLPNGSGWGDHIQFLQIYEQWAQNQYSLDWCEKYNLPVGGMGYACLIHQHLLKAVMKFAKVNFTEQNNLATDYSKIRRCLCVGYASQLAERMLYHNGYMPIGKSDLFRVHPSSVLRPVAGRELPEYVVFHELIFTSQTYMRTVCRVENDWATPVMEKFKNINLEQLRIGCKQSRNFAWSEEQKKAATDRFNLRYKGKSDGYHPWLDPAPLPPVIKGLKVPKSSSSTEKGNIHITKSVSSEMQCNSDRAWSDAEEGDIVSSSFDVVGGYEETSIQKKKEAQVIKRQVHSNGTRMTLPQSKKLSQRISDNAIWEDQQLLKSGVARGTELQTDYDNEEERRVTLLVHDAKPPFLDGRIVFTKQADPIIPLKDPTSDMAKISRKGSNLVREVHEKQSMDKSRQRFWELPGSKLGNILGVEKSAEQFDADTSLVGEHGEVDFKGDAKFAKHMKKELAHVLVGAQKEA
ncbi:RNA helicase family protein [Artemisia annua]|uniref:RNA helicase n=1 Tax=Artemisia annua TaxID=35608 RepID=A0A2U1PTJ6_ARTAN|nr:RNA helicase family protein [Artemisia annua]